jgi:eukaryotic-like serine/threonine-protein kinase
MTGGPSEPDLLNALAEAFLERYRRGERPSVSEYADRHPGLADRIREVLPVLAMMEAAGSEVVPAPADGRGPPRRLGEYRILREVGRGGMGVVYEAVQESLGRHVALKVLSTGPRGAGAALERFRREAKAAARLHHTNIVPVIGVGEADGTNYYTMQFIHGQGLDAVLRDVRRLRADRTDGGPGAKTSAGRSAAAVARSLTTGVFEHEPILESSVANEAPTPADFQSSQSSDLVGQPESRYFREVARLGVQAAEALDYAHQQGVLHRDVKPSNLLLDTRGTLWVTDFGLAKADDSEDLTGTGDLVGTLRYMAPERFQGRADARSDVYALGVTLYELLTLRPAFAETDRLALIETVTRAGPPRPRRFDPSIPRDLETIVLKATARAPGDRYPTAADLAEDLRRFLADRPVRARRHGPVEKTWRWCRRNPAVALLAAAVALLLLTIAVYSSVAAGRLRETLNRVAAAEREKSLQLWDADLARARASRLNPYAGRRFEALRALEEARGLLPGLPGQEERRLALRNEWIAAVSLTDLGVGPPLPGEPAGDGGAAFHPTLDFYARSDGRGAVRVRRVADGTEVAALPAEGRPGFEMRFSPDGRWLAVNHSQWFWNRPNRFRVWDWRRGELVLESEHDTVGVADFSADGRRLAVGRPTTDGRACIRVYELSDTGPSSAVDLPDGPPPDQIAFHPDGRRVAATYLDGRVRLYDAPAGRLVKELAHPRVTRGVAWAADGRWLAVGCDADIYLWDVDAARPSSILQGHRGGVIHIAVSRTGRLLASMAWDGTVRLWDVAAGQERARSPATYIGGTVPLVFGPDGRRLAFFCDGTRLALWDVADGRECLHLEGAGPTGHIRAAFTADGRLLAECGSEGRGVHLWDLASGREAAFLPGQLCSLVHFGPDGRLLVGDRAGLHRHPLIRDGDRLQAGPPDELWPDRTFRPAGADRDGRIVAAVSLDNRFVLVDTHRPDAPIVRGDVPIVAAAVSPDGRRAAATLWAKDTVRVWDTSDGRVVCDLPVPGQGHPFFSPDGRRLLTASLTEYRVWDVNSHGLLLVRDKQPEGISGGAAFAPDGTMALIRSRTQALIDLVAGDGRLLAQLEAPSRHGLSWVTFAADGSRLAACCDRQVTHVWDLRLIREQLRAKGLDWD